MPLPGLEAHDPNVGRATAPLAAFVFPLIGLFMAPIYPGVNLVMLSSLPAHRHAPMTGLPVIFSALVGTTGSKVTGHVFGRFNGQFAFYLTLVPIGLMLVGLFRFRRQVERSSVAAAAQPTRSNGARVLAVHPIVERVGGEAAHPTWLNTGG